jgi:hypothetical protein
LAPFSFVDHKFIGNAVLDAQATNRVITKKEQNNVSAVLHDMRKYYTGNEPHEPMAKFFDEYIKLNDVQRKAHGKADFTEALIGWLAADAKGATKANRKKYAALQKAILVSIITSGDAAYAAAERSCNK